jgi:hypothetical protein
MDIPVKAKHVSKTLFLVVIWMKNVNKIIFVPIMFVFKQLF